jgi:hypothetical protein
MTATHEIASKFNLNTRFLTTNSIPSQHDRNIIRNILSSIDKDIFQSEVDIAHLKKVLDERIIDHIALIQRRASLAAIVSPLRQLPLEIFGQIFAYATLEDKRFPISASHVCQLWHRACLANSDLWTTIWIGNRCQKEYAELFIQRSQSRPMSLKYSERLPPEYLPNFSSVLLEIGCGCRWKDIHVHPSWDNLPKLLSKSWDTLESLVLTAFGNSRAHTIDLTSATRLKHLSVIRDKSSRVMKYDVLKLPCSSLTHLTVDVAITLNDVVSILSECGNLEEFVLTLATLFIYYQDTPPQTHVHLPNLRKLHLHTRVLNQLVKLIETPVLEDLLLHPLDEPTQFSWTDEGVIEFINASKSTLRKFAISMISGVEVMAMLQGMKSLSEFRMVGNDNFDWEALEAMIVKGGIVTPTSGETYHENINEEGHEILLPNLEVLHVICKTYFQVQKAFLDVVRSRWWPEEDSRDIGVTQLKTASLQSINTSERLAFGKEVEEIRRQGIDIQMLEPEGLLEGEGADWVLD